MNHLTFKLLVMQTEAQLEISQFRIDVKEDFGLPASHFKTCVYRRQLPMSDRSLMVLVLLCIWCCVSLAL